MIRLDLHLWLSVGLLLLLLCDIGLGWLASYRTSRRLDKLDLRQAEFFREWEQHSGRIQAALARLEADPSLEVSAPVVPSAPEIRYVPYPVESAGTPAAAYPAAAYPQPLAASFTADPATDKLVFGSWADVRKVGQAVRGGSK